MAKHELRANRTPEKPKAELRAAPSMYDVTHPAGSAERFLDEAAKEALLAAAAGGVPTVRSLTPRAAVAVSKEAGKYPDPLLADAAKLPAGELAKRAARAEAYRQAVNARNKIVRDTMASLSQEGNLARTAVAASASDLLKRQAAKGGRTLRAAQGAQEETPPADAEVPAQPSGSPRIVINPTTFKNSKDALCVAFNEGFRLWMEATGFEPQSEPTEAQRRFFSDTAYADDELQLRRTILARIATFDTSVKDPTDEQLAETAGFLNAVAESGWCKNDWELNSVRKLAAAVEAAVGAEPVEPKAEPVEPRAGAPLEARAALGGGETDEDTPVEPKPVETPSGASGEDPENPVENPAANPAANPAENPAENPEDNVQQPAENPAEQEGNPAQPQENPAANPAENPAEKRGGAFSDIWTGGEPGKGRQLTAAEADWMRRRIDSGASVSGSQLALFGLSRNEKGQLVDVETGNLHTGFGTGLASAGPDAGLDKDERTAGKTKGRRTSSKTLT